MLFYAKYGIMGRFWECSYVPAQLPHGHSTAVYFSFLVLDAVYMLLKAMV